MLKTKKIKTIEPDDAMEVSVGGKYPPSLNLNDSQVSEIKDWDVGETYQMVVDIKMTNKSEDKDGTINASFEVTGYKNMEDMSEEELEDMQGEALSN